MWVEDFKKNILQKSSEKISEWCNFVIKLGLDEEKQTEWLTIFETQITELYDDMIEDAANKQRELIENIEELLKKAVAYSKILEVNFPDYEEQQLGLYAVAELLKQEITK